MSDIIEFKALGPGPVYERTDIWLPQLVAEALRRGEQMIEGKTFIDCKIEGPAVFCPVGGVSFEGCDLGNSGGDIRNLMLAPLGPDKITGAIAFRNCIFRSCNLFAVGFTGSPEFLKDMHDGVSGPAA